MPRIGPHSRPAALARLDGRTREGRLLAQTRRELTAHVGGSPSPTQRGLIERCAWLSLHVAMLDARVAERGGLSARDAREYLAWSNALERALRRLGPKGAAARPPSLIEHIAARRSAG